MSQQKSSSETPPCCEASAPSKPASCGEAPAPTQAVSCCGPSAPGIAFDVSWVTGIVDSAIGPIPRARTVWTHADHRGEVRARLGFGRMRYAVPPGLYAVGNPTPASPVFVSANYKLSFDHLRRALGSIDGWILVLDTKGVNVWCAAGKGTFGTEELVTRIRATRLSQVVEHHRLILPQLGAPGVAAPLVQKETGFRVIYGPVRATDIPAFLAADMKATDEMRRVRFDLADRAVLVPQEMMGWGRFALPVAAVLLLAAGFHRGGYDFSLVGERGVRAAILMLAAWLAGTTVAPLLLPWIPGRAFSVKGGLLGLALAAIAILSHWVPHGSASSSVGGASGLTGPSTGLSSGSLEAAAWLLIAPAIAAFQVMNFTGSTTYTSLSGVKREMRFAVPAEIAAGGLGLVAWIVTLFMK